MLLSVPLTSPDEKYPIEGGLLFKETREAYEPASVRIVVEKGSPTSTSKLVAPTILVGVGATMRKGTLVVAVTVEAPTDRLALRVSAILVVPFGRGCALALTTRLLPSKLTPL